ncbi:MAG TPA: aminodeoxychorismate synthase component I [bacterium]
MGIVADTPGTVLVQRDGADWLLFTRPQNILCAHTLDDVRPLIEEVERCTARGLWAAGFLSYEAAPAFDPALVTHERAVTPLAWFGIYEAPQSLSALPEGAEAFEAGAWISTVTEESYAESLSRIKEYIAGGDTYQVNFTLRLRTGFEGSPWSLFRHLVRNQSPRCAAYVHAGEHVLCSASPELFFRLDGSHITCRPMKGTAPRGLTSAEDALNTRRLQASEKERAENVMIVDMVRNDLSRIAARGSVHVPELFAVERYYTLLQLTSTVAAETHAPLGELLAALFPCASITGAPKVRTMQIIRELETTPRGVYTGSIGYVSPQRRMQFNVAIRTVDIDTAQRTAEYGTGGGIVWDSRTGREYEECLLKAAVLTASRPDFSLLETLLWKPPSGFFLLERHLERLLSSADYFAFRADKQQILAALTAAVEPLEQAPHKIRLQLSEGGAIRVEAELLSRNFKSRRWRVALAGNPIDSHNRFLYHKTTARSVYNAAQAGHPGCDDVLLWNERGDITESTVANVVAQFGRELVTPPVSCGLLAGAYRAHLLAKGRIAERCISKDELRHAERVYLINSVRGWIPVDLAL